jgi:hypothetical protein
LVSPAAGENLTQSTQLFKWTWEGTELPAKCAFEIRIWHASDEPHHYGAHDVMAGKDTITPDADGVYAPTVSMAGVYSVKTHGNSPDYFWTVAIVAISPYKEQPIAEAPPRSIQINLAGGGGDGGGSAGGGGPGPLP